MIGILLSNRANNLTTLLRGSRQLSGSVRSRDFFGIDHVTSKDISAAFKSETKLDNTTLNKRYRPLMMSKDTLVNEEEDIIDCSFGKMRLDIMNCPKTHGQFDLDQDTSVLSELDLRTTYLQENTTDDQGKVDTNMAERNQSELELEMKLLKEHAAKMNPAYKISEVRPVVEFTKVVEMFETQGTKIDRKSYVNKPPLHFVFQKTSRVRSKPYHVEPSRELLSPEGLREHRQNNLNSKNQITKEDDRPQKNQDYMDDKDDSSTKLGHLSNETFDTNSGDKLKGQRIEGEELNKEIAISHELGHDKKPPLVYNPENDRIPLHELDISDEDYHKRHDEELLNMKFDQKLDEQYDENSATEIKVKAYDHLRKVRSNQVEPAIKQVGEKIKKKNSNPLRPKNELDSKGFRTFTGQVPNWASTRRVDIISFLKDNIVYHNYGILVLNKPYGLASHCDDHKSDGELNVNDLMQEVAKELKLKNRLHLVHRLDKTTTGALMFADNHAKAKKLNKLLKEDLIKKTYWCITKGVPANQSATIDIPIGEYLVAGKLRSCVAPEGVPREHQFVKKFKEARRAVTEYSVIQANKHVALLEVKPRSGVKHQIRCHLSQGINRPILGDHKYSHFTRLAPQRLPDPLLALLHVRQSKVRTLPIHLHAKSLVIPGAKANGETLFVDVPLPQFFRDNLKTLKLMKGVKI